MEKYYYKEPYKKEIKTKITNIEKINGKTAFQVEETIFYPEAGGQPGDIGYLKLNNNKINIIDSQKTKDKVHVLHFIEGDSSLSIGDEVELILNWNNRYKFMQSHSAQHLLSSIFYRYFNCATVATHLGNEIITIEIDKDYFALKDCLKIEEIANKVIRDNKKITCSIYEHETAEKLPLRRSIKVTGKVRIIEIEDNDLIACGGILVNSTGEIKLITYAGQEKIRGHIRTQWQIADQAISQIHEDKQVIKMLNEKLSSQEFELETAVKNLQENLKDAKREAKNCLELLSTLIIEKNVKDEINILKLPTDYSFIPLKEFNEALIGFDKTVLIFSSKDDKTNYLIHFSEKLNSKLPGFKEQVISKVNAKGGGKFPTFQGILTTNKIEAFSKAFIDYFKD